MQEIGQPQLDRAGERTARVRRCAARLVQAAAEPRPFLSRRAGRGAAPARENVRTPAT